MEYSKGEVLKFDTAHQLIDKMTELEKAGYSTEFLFSGKDKEYLLQVVKCPKQSLKSTTKS